MTFETTSVASGDAVWSIEELGGLWDLYTYLETTEGDAEEITVPRTYSGTGKGYNWVGSEPTSGEGVYWAQMNASVYKIEVYNAGYGYRSFYLDMRNPDLNCLSAGQNGDFQIIYDFDDSYDFILEGSSEDPIEIDHGELITIWDIKESTTNDQSDLEALSSFDIQYKWHHSGHPYIWYNKRESGNHELWRRIGTGKFDPWVKVQDRDDRFYYLDVDIGNGTDPVSYRVITTNFSSSEISLTGGLQKGILDPQGETPKAPIVGNIVYPNPFNPSTNISFNVHKEGMVDINIYNVQGELVKALTNKFMSTGRYTESWDASSYNAGIYFCVTRTPERTYRQKLLLVK